MNNYNQEAEGLAKATGEAWIYCPEHDLQTLPQIILKTIPLASLLEARDQLEELKKLLPDVGYITCIYCGFKAKYKDEAEKLADHITSCEKNPVLQMCKEACDKLELSEANVIAVSEECEILRADLTAEKQAHRECHAGMVTELEKLRAELALWVGRCSEYVSEEQTFGTHKEHAFETERFRSELTAIRQSSAAILVWVETNDMTLPHSKEVLKGLANVLYDTLHKGVLDDAAERFKQ